MLSEVPEVLGDRVGLNQEAVISFRVEVCLPVVFKDVYFEIP